MDHDSSFVNPQLHRLLAAARDAQPASLRGTTGCQRPYALGSTYRQIMTKWIAVPAMTITWKSSW